MKLLFRKHVLLFFMLSPLLLYPQDKVLPKDSINRTEYFRPIITSNILRGGELDLVNYNFLESRIVNTEDINDGGAIIRSKLRYLVNTLQVNYGLKMRSRINLGLDISYYHVLTGQDTGTRYFKILARSGVGEVYRSFHSIGPRLRIAPFNYIPELTFQSSLMFPMSGDQDTRRKIGADRVSLQTQISFYQHIFRNVTLQVQTSYSVFLKNQIRLQTSHYFTHSGFMIYRIYQNQVYLIGTLQYNEERRNTITNAFKRSNYSLFVGGGIYFEIIRKILGLSLLYEVPLVYDSGSLVSNIEGGTWWKSYVGIRYFISR